MQYDLGDCQFGITETLEINTCVRGKRSAHGLNTLRTIAKERDLISGRLAKIEPGGELNSN